MNVAYNIDCMEYMKTCENKQFDLAIVDPPYGGGHKLDADESQPECSLEGGAADWENKKRGRLGSGIFEKHQVGVNRAGGTWAEKYGLKITHWDIAPPPEYFNELAKVSKNQIIGGGNYFDLPPRRCFLV